MVFGKGKLQDEIFCLTEERDYFQSKFLEQVNEIAALKDQLGRARKEIDKLRMELMHNGLDGANDEDDDGNFTNKEGLSINVDGVRTPSPRHSPRKKKHFVDDQEEKKDDTSELTT